jgi:hypothetical protein
MDGNRNKKLENITNGINAAHKIKSIQNSMNPMTRDSSNPPDTMAMLSQVLEVIASYYPDNGNTALSERIQKSNLYGEAYRNMKHHVKTLQSNSRFGGKDLIKTLHIIKPIMDSQRKDFIEKLIKIHEIINS